MKLLCIGRNYGDHARELGNAVPAEPVFFLKPATALLQHGNAIRLPRFSSDVHHELEVVFRVGRTASHISSERAWEHLDAYTLGLDLTARDVQQEQKEKGLPWEKAKAWDGSAPMSDTWTAIDPGTPPGSMAFSLERNGRVVQRGTTDDMLFPVPALVAYLSRFITLEPGDLVFTGTPAGVGPLAPGDVLEGKLDGRTILTFNVEAEGER
ncbi:MAG TPA: fumarylacetoacetate hydrolase family protein [Flavobacteriales bacterium]|mgnify:CR=1 FL=1|nr:fumarylacetoacetate hydrolase family protein [Flavobacteriales bacterium]MCB9181276.1 fumarylacetoacetate hydrolase family protein [Flavobacteriales bacterium]MCB9199238.1 fumarylacetoacetate hydrolase family protein [Flavobacteriales bacterium]HOP42893.1 fumarylacetoacetate hydrolase family protein [Flavobacteriales bacterium]